MSINFTGIKNVGSMNVMMPPSENIMTVLSMQVTNDEDGNDLDDFKAAVQKTGHSKMFLIPYEGSVSVNVSTSIPDNEYEQPKHSFYLNGSPLEVNDRNLPIFSYLARTTTKLSEKSERDFGVTEEYLESKDFINGSSVGFFVKQAFLANPNVKLAPLLNSIYAPPVAKNGAKVVNMAINNTMSDYLA